MEDLLERVVKDSTNGTRLKTVHEASKDTLGEWYSKFLRMHLRCRTMLLACKGWTVGQRMKGSIFLSAGGAGALAYKNIICIIHSEFLNSYSRAPSCEYRRQVLRVALACFETSVQR